MTVRGEIAQSRGEVHGAKNNEVRDATSKERHACARARAGERPVSSVCARRRGGEPTVS